MKLFIKTTFLLLTFLLPALASAHNFVVDGIYYKINGNEATVTFKGSYYYDYSYEYSGSVVIPPTVTYNGATYSVTSIGGEAFYNCTGLTSITIPNSVTSIGYEAFRSCTGLTSIVIPNSVTSIGDWAFSYCSGLTSIVVESGNPSYDSRNNCNAIIETASNTLIAGCKNTVIPNSVTSIGGSAFYGCSGMTSISIPNSVTSIGGEAFYNCTGLTSITIPNSVTSIGDLAFYGCTGLTSITIPNSMTSIGGGAFYNCTGLTSITIGNSVTSIGDEAFSFCSGLTSIVVESGNPSYDSRNNCNAIIETASNTLIAGCKNTVIHNSVTSIGGSAFRGCSGLTSISIPNSVTSIGGSAFYGCSGLTSITIPNSVTSIGGYAFHYCSGLTSITIPNSVTSIGDWVFYGCSGLNQVLSYITDLSRISMGNSVFYRSPANYGDRTLFVPQGTAADYQADNKWSQYFGSIVEIEGYENEGHLSMSDTAACRRDIVRIPVKMTNTASIISFQTDIFLPEGLELVQEDGEYLIEPSARMTPSHVIMSNDVSNGAIRVLCYSSSYKPFEGNSGDDLFYLTVKVADDAEGDYTIQLKNTLLTKSDFVDVAAPDVAAHVNVKGYLLGDANMSGAITVTDVVVTAQYILERNPSPFEFEAADVNRDNNITVADVSRIAWMILNAPLNAPRRAPAVWNSGDRMGAEGITLAAGETRRVSIQLDNEADYNAFQLDLQLPDGLTASNLCLTDRAGSHTLDAGTLKDGKIRALCYSPSLAVIKGRSGALLTLDVTAAADVTGDITVDGIELVSADCQSVKLDAFAIGVNHTTALNEPAAVKKTVATVAYYNLAGQRMTRPSTGVTLVVTTYTDGSQTTSKVIR